MQHFPVFILYVNYNNCQDLQESLQHLFKSADIPFSILIADNDSADGSVMQLENWLKEQKKPVRCWDECSFKTGNASELEQINIISLNKNYGFGKANNILIKKVIDEDAFIWLLNPDVMVSEDCLKRFYEAAIEDKNAIFGARILSYKNEQLLYNGGFMIRKISGTIKFNKTDKDPEIISGGCLFTHSSILKKVGPFPEEYFLYWEDAVLCKKATDAGVAIRYVPDAISLDKGSTTIGKGYLAEYYYSRNALRFIKDHYPAFVPFVLIFNIFRGLKRIMMLKFDKLKAVYKATSDFLNNK